MITGDDYIAVAAQLAAGRNVGEASYRLRDLHAERIIADYRWEKRTTGNQRDAKTSVETAHAIRLALFAGGHEASKNLVRTGIQNYLQKRGE
jgi:hypothetical protein